ncbi:unnamed protein product, partial [Durusdinium trenchii]
MAAPTIVVDESQVDGLPETQAYSDLPVPPTQVAEPEKSDTWPHDAQPRDTFMSEEKVGEKPETGETALTGPAQPEPDREAEVPAAQPSQGLVRQNAFLEEEVDSQVVICKKCHLEQDINTVVIRGPREMWCRACNALYTLLRRNLAWPPVQFATMTKEQQAQFFSQCQKDREESMKSSFCFCRVKDTLTKVMIEEQVKQRRLEVSVSESDIQSSVERSVLEAERN